MELTEIQTAILVCVYLFGVFSCRFAAQFFEVCHAYRLVEKVVYRCLLMCSKIHEDAEFLKEIKYNHLKKADFDKKRLQEFMEVDAKFMSNWKESIIQTILVNTPLSFSFAIKFTNWREAMRQLDEMHEEQQ